MQNIENICIRALCKVVELSILPIDLSLSPGLSRLLSSQSTTVLCVASISSVTPTGGFTILQTLLALLLPNFLDGYGEMKG